MTSKEIIQIKNLSYRRSKKDRPLFKNVNLSVSAGEKIVIHGSNGSGKTTLLRCVIGVLTPSAGKIIVAPGTNIGVQLQQISYPEQIKVEQVVTFFAEMIGSSVLLIQRARYFTYFQIQDIWDRPVNRLSNGQKRRLNLMMAFINKPHLLMLDEPTAELDNVWTAKTIKFVNDYTRRNHTALVLFTNDEAEVKALHIRKSLQIVH